MLIFLRKELTSIWDRQTGGDRFTESK
jgi:hypothetical protein